MGGAGLEAQTCDSGWMISHSGRLPSRAVESICELCVRMPSKPWLL